MILRLLSNEKAVLEIRHQRGFLFRCARNLAAEADTLARAVFADKPYISLENPAELLFAKDDPRGFLARFPDGAIFDEAQRWPELFSWLQGIVDEDRRGGREGMTQLLPLSLAEWPESAKPGLDDMLLTGGYPAAHPLFLSIDRHRRQSGTG